MQENTRENAHLRDHREENEARKPRIIEARYETRAREEVVAQERLGGRIALSTT